MSHLPANLRIISCPFGFEISKISDDLLRLHQMCGEIFAAHRSGGPLSDRRTVLARIFSYACPFNLDDLGPEIGEVLRGQGPARIRDISRTRVPESGFIVVIGSLNRFRVCCSLVSARAH